MAITDYGVNFGGRRIVHPGAYKVIDASEMVAATEGSLNIPIVVGRALAGQSGVVTYFTSPDEARQYLRGGDLVTALDLMFSPTPEGGGGASRVGVIVANKTEQAKATLGGIEFKSLEYGDGGNKVLVRCEDGAVTGSKKYTISRWDLDALEVLDNVGSVIRVAYTGTEAYAVANVTVAEGKATKIEFKVGADEATATVDLSLDLASGEFRTISEVVAHINGILGYTANLVNPNSGNLSVSMLDAVVDANIKTANHLFAMKGDIEQRFSIESVLVSASVAGTIANFDPTYLTGGATGTTPSSWASYFDLIKKQFSDILVLLTDDETIHAEALSHVGSMENRNQSQLLFVGGGSRETPAQAKTRAANLNSSRAVVAYPGIFFRGYEGGKAALPAYFTAAMLAGRVAGVPANEPITFDYFSILGLDTDLIAGDPEIDDLITSGVATLERVQNGGFRLVQGITTYQGNNTLYREISVRRGADDLSERIRRGLEAAFTGKNGTRATKTSVTTKVVDYLEQAIKNDEILSYRNIIVTMQSTIIRVDYQVAPVEPNNYILVTSRFVPETAAAN
ncbi:Phage tail sheath protein [compost metagenome]